MIDYLNKFPLPLEVMPDLLYKMLSPIDSFEPDLMIEITKRYELKNPNNEYCHMAIATIPEKNKNCIQLMRRAAEDGLVQFSTPCCDKKGELKNISYSLDGYDYLVASYGSSNFYTYNLAEKVWLTLGLSQRCVGNEHQKIEYDDLEEPVINVAQGDISNEFHWEQSKNIKWEMRNNYLRKYLWMRGHIGVRSFYYKSYVEDSQQIRALMQGESHFRDTPEGGWYDLDIREHINGLLLIQVWATIVAILPKKCNEKDIRKLQWPGDTSPMSKAKTCGIPRKLDYPYIYLNDDFLKKYENDRVYECIPMINPDGICYCDPSYKGQWSFYNLRRIGRNIIKVSIYDLYEKAIPDKEILHAYKYAISPIQANSFDPKEENIVEKTKRFIEEIIKLGNSLFMLSYRLGIDIHQPEEYIGISQQEIYANGWRRYKTICKIAKVSSLNMSAEDFLSRCKIIHEFLQEIKSDLLKKFLIIAGSKENNLKNLKNFKLLERIKNILDYLIKNHESISAWKDSILEFDWEKSNSSISALFVNRDLRLIDSHEIGSEVSTVLKRLGFDSAQLARGHGKALDFIFDEIIKSIQSINNSFSILLLNTGKK